MAQPTKPFSGLRRVNSDNAELIAMQLQVEQALQRIAAFPIVGGILVEGLKTTATDVDVFVYHELGRAAKGFVLTDTDNPLLVYKSPTANSFKDRQLIVRPNYSGAVRTFSLWVF